MLQKRIALVHVLFLLCRRLVCQDLLLGFMDDNNIWKRRFGALLSCWVMRPHDLDLHKSHTVGAHRDTDLGKFSYQNIPQ